MTKVGFKIEAEEADKVIKEMGEIKYRLSEIGKEASKLKKEKDKAGFLELEKEAEKLRDRQRELRGEMKTMKAELNDVVNKFRIGGVTVGEYKSAIEKTAKGAKLMSGAMEGNIKVLRLLKIAIAGTGIGLLVIALGALYTYLTKTQKGMDFVNKVMTVAGTIIGDLIERAAKLGEALFYLASGKFQKAWEATKASFAGFGKELSNDIKLSAELADRQAALRQEEQGVTVILAERRNKVKDLSKLIEDQTAAEKDRIAAGKEAAAITKQITDIENAFYDKKIALLKEQQSLGLTSREEEQELADLIAERADKETANLELQTTLQNKLNSALGVNKDKVEELVKGPLDRMRDKVKMIYDLIQGGSLSGNALEEKIREMLNLQEEVDKMEKSIEEITNRLSRGQTPSTFSQLDSTQTTAQFDFVGSTRDPEVDRVKLSQDEIREYRKENEKQMKEDYLQSQEELKELEKKNLEERKAVFDDFAVGIGDIVADVLDGQIKTLKGFEKAFLSILVGSVEKAINVLLAQAFAKLFADNPPPLAIAGFALVQGLVKGFFSGVKAQINKNETGGIIPSDGGVLVGPSHAQGGIRITPTEEAEGGEAVINKHSTAAFRGLLSQINSFNGWGKKFARGGITSGNNIPAFVPAAGTGGAGFQAGAPTSSFISQESMSTLAAVLQQAVTNGIGEGLYDAARINERRLIGQKLSRI